MRRRDAGIALGLALLCVAAYAPSLNIPLIADDYPNITKALEGYGKLSGLPDLFRDPVFRLRATSYWAMYALWQAFHLTPIAYHIFSLLLHIANTLLVYRLSRVGAVAAAAFFAVHEGHQEAVMWFSAVNELLMFFFGMASLLCWKRSRVLSVVLFAMALISKESAVIFLPLLILCGVRPSGLPPGFRPARAYLPYVLLTLAAVASIVTSRGTSFRFSDGSFSLHAPFYITWPRSYFRELWVWGWIAATFLWFRRRKIDLIPLVWIGIALIPYSFLTYQTAIPSRQTYLASAGLAWLVGQAFAVLPQRPRVIPGVVIAAILASNLGILWIRKRAQFLERARPTEELIAVARSTAGPIWVRCFPLAEITAREAVRLGAGRDPAMLFFGETGAARLGAVVFCYQREAPGGSPAAGQKP